jgi:hypothetical protein
MNAVNTAEPVESEKEVEGMIRVTEWSNESEKMLTQWGPLRLIQWLGREQHRLESSGIRTEIYRLLGRAALFKYANKSP